jgi:hypothetical protein
MEKWLIDTDIERLIVLGEKHFREWVVDGRMSVEQRWNYTDRGK